MGLAHSGRAEQDHILGALQEAQLVEALDLPPLDARLEAEVELLKRLDRRFAGQSLHLTASAYPRSERRCTCTGGARRQEPPRESMMALNIG